MTTTGPWRPVVDAAIASRRADCGHALSRRDDAYVWLRTKKVGAVTEIWSVCVDCHVEGQDYEYRVDRPEQRPYRERRELL